MVGVKRAAGGSPAAGVLAGVVVMVVPAAGLAQEAVATRDPASEVETVVVTARKRPQALAEAADSVTVFSAQALDDLDIRGVTEFATKTPNLSFAYGNGATAVGDARTIAIRGVTGPNTTAVYIDQTPVPGSIDPRLLDLDRIEVLKGPQGTIYGEASLGGAVKLVTRAPDLHANGGRVGAGVGLTRDGGSTNADAEAVFNQVLAQDWAAVRAVGFYEHQAGWLTRTFPDPADPSVRIARDDQGAQTRYGGSLAALVRVTPDFDATLRVLYQVSEGDGFPAAFAPLPAFRPQATLERAFDVQPRLSDRWVSPSVELAWRGDGWRLESSTSWFRRRVRELEDSTIGTAQFLDWIGAPLAAQPYAWEGDRRREQVSHETRLSFGGEGRLSGVAGVFYSQGRDDFVIPPIYGQGLAASGAWYDDLLWLSDIEGEQRNAAVFGEVSWRVRPDLTVTAGARQYWLKQTYNLRADGFLDGGPIDGPPGNNRESGVSPRLAVSWRPDGDGLIWASAAKGFRAGGTGQATIPMCDTSLADIGLNAEQARRYGSDTVWSYEIGGRRTFAGGRLMASAAAYRLDWRDIQQTVFLPSCGFLITANAGSAEVNGAELELEGRPLADLQVRLGLGYADARLTDPGYSGRAAGARVLQTPRVTATAAATWRRPITATVTGFASLDASWIGDSVSAKSGAGRELVRPAYGLVNARFGLERGGTELSLDLSNLTDARPNLGDIGYLGYEQQDPATGLPVPQVATLPPLTAMVRVRRGF